MEIFEILKYIIPSLIVFITAYLIITAYFNSENKKRQLEINLANKDMINPIRFQAYERIILFLERISPDSLIMRVHQPWMTLLQFQSALIQSIREEFEHNLSQQLYVSSSAWENARNAKDETIKIIYTAAARLSENETANSTDLCTQIFEVAVQLSKLPTQMAIENIKIEFRKIF